MKYLRAVAKKALETAPRVEPRITSRFTPRSDAAVLGEMVMEREVAPAEHQTRRVKDEAFARNEMNTLKPGNAAMARAPVPDVAEQRQSDMRTAESSIRRETNAAMTNPTRTSALSEPGEAEPGEARFSGVRGTPNPMPSALSEPEEARFSGVRGTPHSPPPAAQTAGPRRNAGKSSTPQAAPFTVDDDLPAFHTAVAAVNVPIAEAMVRQRVASVRDSFRSDEPIREMAGETTRIEKPLTPQTRDVSAPQREVESDELRPEEQRVEKVPIPRQEALRSALPEFDGRSETPQSSETRRVHVQIGRIEVRAAPAPSPPSPPRVVNKARPMPATSLRDYLAKHKQGWS